MNECARSFYWSYPLSKYSSLAFGYLPQHLSLDFDDISISTLPALEEKISSLEASGRIHRDWIYPGLQPVADLQGTRRIAPYPSRVFGLPKTHELALRNSDGSEEISFLVWGLSFFLGIRLTTTEAGFLDATPVRTGKLVDFVVLPRDIAKAIVLTRKFWTTNAHDTSYSKLVEAAMHAFFLAQYPQNLEFERFVYLYTALDACFKLATLKENLNEREARAIGHRKRIKWMCDLFNMRVPAWADPSAPSGCRVDDIRNDAIHEAMFLQKPLGFAGKADGNLTLEMEALTCRLIAALLGADATTYIKTPLDTRQYFGLEI